MNCPKCGGKISFFDLKPNCKHCGVNIMYYIQERDLIRDAKKSELEFASARILGKNLMGTYLGKLPIFRLIVSLLSLATLIIPFAEYSYNLPLFERKFTISGLGIYNMISNGSLIRFGNYYNSTLFSDSSVAIITLFSIFLLIVVFCLSLIVFYLLSFVNNSYLAKLSSISSFIIAGLSIVLFIISLFFKYDIKDKSFLDISIGYGAVVSAVMFIINGIVNIKLSKLDISPEYRQFDVERKELLKAYKKGELDLDTLSLPIFETEEEKIKRLEALEEAIKNQEEGA